MRALYSLVSLARTVCALGQATITFVRAGPSALTPVQLLVLGCALCILVRVLMPSPSSRGHRRAVLLDRLCSAVAAVAVIGLVVSDAAGFCFVAGQFALGV